MKAHRLFENQGEIMDMEKHRFNATLAAIFSIACTLQSIVNLTETHVDPIFALLVLFGTCVALFVFFWSLYQVHTDKMILKGIARQSTPA